MQDFIKTKVLSKHIPSTYTLIVVNDVLPALIMAENVWIFLLAQFKRYFRVILKCKEWIQVGQYAARYIIKQRFLGAQAEYSNVTCIKRKENKNRRTWVCGAVN